MLSTIVLLSEKPDVFQNFHKYPWAWAMVALFVLAFANIPRAIFLGRPFYAFISSSATILFLVFLFSFTLYPNLVVSSLIPSYLSILGPNNSALPPLPANFNLTIYSAASSPKTLGIMTIIALIGMPFVLAYTIAIYWAFRGKVKLTEHSY
jgi:cytochrome d ubiquinol oxidase subunit II